MTRQSATRAIAGLLLIVLAFGAAVLSRDVDRAGREFRGLQAAQRSPAGEAPETAGRLQEAAESLLGIRAQSEVMRAYIDYRARLASVIQGTVYPQTQARWNAITTLGRLRPSLGSAHDRAAVDVALGLVLASSAAASGPTTQRQALQRNAIAAFRRGVLEDPANVQAKYDLEVLLAGLAAAEAERETRAPVSAGRRASRPLPLRASPRLRLLTAVQDETRHRREKGVMAATLVLLTPRASLIAVAFLVPLAALAIRERRGARLRTMLGLTHRVPHGGSRGRWG